MRVSNTVKKNLSTLKSTNPSRYNKGG